MVILASGEVIKESFRQEKKINRKDIARIPRVFIDVKIKLRVERRKNTMAKSSKEKKRKGVIQDNNILAYLPKKSIKPK
ncbi:MAG TPA: hypothetical protein VIV35_10590 [Chitinophagaceae bacterium]